MAHARMGRVYPLLYLAATRHAVVRYLRGNEGAARMAIFAGPLAVVGVMLVSVFPE